MHFEIGIVFERYLQNTFYIGRYANQKGKVKKLLSPYFCLLLSFIENQKCIFVGNFFKRGDPNKHRASPRHRATAQGLPFLAQLQGPKYRKYAKYYVFQVSYNQASELGKVVSFLCFNREVVCPTLRTFTQTIF